MGKLIRFDPFCTIALFLVLSLFLISDGYGQISITDSRSFELSFTEGETKTVPGGIEVSVHDPLISPSSENGSGRAERFASSGGQRGGKFYVEAYGDISFGSYYHQLESNNLITLPLINKTSQPLGKLSVAFDFIFLAEQLEQEQTFRLSYRVNGGEWISPGEGTFSTDFLRSGDRGWGTFSMQISLDQLYLHPDDEIEIRWSSSANETGADFFPLALQKAEFYPSVAEPKQVRPGSLIITEILPFYESEQGFIEYAEIYNSTESPINLKGLILDTGRNEVTIQRDLIVSPYSTIVIANYENLDRFGSNVDYKYSGTLLGLASGRLEARFGEKVVAKAMFDITEPGVAHQLNHLQNAYDGYSSMRHLEPVRVEWGSQIFGTPGFLNQNRKLYSKKITDNGWHIFNPPGNLSADLNRDQMADIKPFNLTENNDNVPAAAPYIYYKDKEDEDSVTMFSVGVSDKADGRKGSRLVQLNEPDLKSIDIGESTAVSVDRLVNQRGSQAFPAFLTWSSETQSFELIWDREDTIVPWSAIFAPGISSDRYEIQVAEPKDENKGWNGLNRVIELSLIDQSDSDGVETVSDRALMGFWNAPSALADERLDLPKIWSPVGDSPGDIRSPLIYLKSAGARYEANSYLNFDRIPNEVIQVSVGLRLQHYNGRYRIQWDRIGALPDHWDIEFVDTELDEMVDMRRNNSYTFTERSDGITQGMRDPQLNFQEVEKTEYNRFIVRISASGSLGQFEEEEESPESFELRQNYPNPFNPSTTVVFYLPESAQVQVGVYNVVGQKVGVLVDERLSAGEHSVMWNAMDMPSGVYIVQLEAGNTVDTRKITLIK